MPSVALTRATAPPSRFGCMVSRRMLTPSEITPMPMPCSTRPTSIGISVSDSADTTEPSNRQTSSAKYIRRLPNMSPRRPLIGIEMDAASSVDVSTQEASAVFDCSSSGSRGMIGVTIVCMNEATRPPVVSTARIARSLGIRVSIRRSRSVRTPRSSGAGSVTAQAYARTIHRLRAQESRLSTKGTAWW